MEATKIHDPNGVLYACHPAYGNGIKESHRQFYAQSVNPFGPYAGMSSIYKDYGGSLLPDSFNQHWREALNLQIGGTNVTRFVMLHDDVAPEAFWIDKLLEILDNTPDADLVAVATPIKDLRGLSSTGIDDPEDDWEIYRRFTMKEIHRLPETFCAKDTEYPERLLLANTGCWACRFDRPWRYKMFFEIRTRMVFYPRGGGIIAATDFVPGMQGKFGCQVMPEDWLFSKLLGSLGGKVYITRSIKLDHYGQFPFPNYDSSWGKWEHDESLAKKFDIVNAAPQVRGFISEREGQILAKYAEGKSVLEIGSWCGLSTIWMARKANMVMCVDTFDGRGMPVPGNTLDEFNQNMAKYNVTDKVFYTVNESKNALPNTSGFFDFVFIDGAHDAKSIREDYTLAQRAIRHDYDTFIAFHDYHADYPAVTEFVDKLLDTGYEKEEHIGDLIVLKPRLI